MKRKRPVLIAVVLILAATAPAAADTSPSQVVEKLHAALLASMKSGDQQSCARRFETLLPVVTASFDFPFIARLAVGRYWRKLQEAQQQALITALTRMSAAAYARNFDSFSGQRFETLELKQSRKDKAVVKTLLTTTKEEVDLDYICRNTDDGWKIVSVAARGVNDLSMKRAEYTSFLRDHDIAALIEKINAKTEKCTSGKAS